MARRDELEISRSRTLRSRRALAARESLRWREGWGSALGKVGLGLEGTEVVDALWMERPVVAEPIEMERGLTLWGEMGLGIVSGAG